MTHGDWMSIMVRGARRLESVPFGLAIVDPTTGAIRYHNPAMAMLLGQPPPATVADVDAVGVVSAQDRDLFLAIRESLGDEDSCAVVDTEVTDPDGQVKEITVRVAHFHAVRGDGSVLVVTATDFDNTFDYTDLELSLDPPGEIHVVYDLDLVAVAVDQRLLEYGIDPADHVGTHAFLMGHPEDTVTINPKARAVAVGEAREAQYAIRVIGPAAAWTTVAVTISRFRGRDDLLLVTNIPQDIFQVPLEDQALDEREMAIGHLLLAGHRPAKIAEEHGLSVHTVRHRMTTLFRTLGVDSQVELQRKYLSSRL